MTPAAYWDRVAGTKHFGHPLDVARLVDLAPAPLRVLDVGCGEGRLLAALHAAGHRRLRGVDIAPRMLERARRAVPAAELRVIDGLHLPFEDDAFDAVLFAATFTSAPADEVQRALAAEAMRVLAPGGVVFVSDLPLQHDERNRARYARGAPGFAHGAFALDDGGVCRHHPEGHFEALFAGLELIARDVLDGRTMNGNPIRMQQLWLRAPAAGPRR